MNEALVLEQNKIASSGAWIWLLEIATTGLSTLRYANNNSVIKWRDDPSDDVADYLPLSFTMSDIVESTSGKFPEYKLQIGDVELDSSLRTRVRETGGLVGGTVRLLVVHSDHLDLTTAAIDELAEILNCEITAEAITFTIGTPSLLGRRFPRDRYVPGFCRHRFKGALCQYVQPDRTRTSSQISFTLGEEGEAGVRFNTITCGTGNLVENVFKYAPGVSHFDPYRRALTKDTGFTVSGSKSNDGFFLANNRYFVRQTYVQVFQEADKARPFVAESAGNNITIQLGYDKCDHTLDACALRDNTRHYGGSPGIVGGMYG